MILYSATLDAFFGRVNVTLVAVALAVTLPGVAGGFGGTTVLLAMENAPEELPSEPPIVGVQVAVKLPAVPEANVKTNL